MGKREKSRWKGLRKEQDRKRIELFNQEKYLKVFLEDGNVPMDNNAAERAIKNFCIGRKNWLIIDTIRGAQSSAIIYSIAETAKANKLKPILNICWKKYHSTWRTQT